MVRNLPEQLRETIAEHHVAESIVELTLESFSSSLLMAPSWYILMRISMHSMPSVVSSAGTTFHIEEKSVTRVRHRALTLTMGQVLGSHESLAAQVEHVVRTTYVHGGYSLHQPSGSGVCSEREED